MASHQYSLRWNNYVTHISTAFDSLRGDRDLVDVTLSCEGKKIPAHKMLLSACSSYFKSLFKENPCQHPVIIFRNVAFEDLMALVDFMYKGEVNVEQEQLASFLNTAEMLEVQGLTNSGKDVDSTKKTAEEAKTVSSAEVPSEKAASAPFHAPFNSLDESSQPSPGTSASARKRRRMSPNRTEDESLPKIATVSVDEPVIQPMEHVPLKTEAPDFEHIELNPDDSVDNVLDGSGMPGGSMDPGDMDNYAMAGPSNESMGDDKEPVLFHEPFIGLSEGIATAMERPVQVVEMYGKFFCSECDKGFTTQAQCKQHLDVHLGKTSCLICSKTFSRATDLRKHQEVHSGKTKCQICHKVLSCDFALRRHISGMHPGQSVVRRK